MKKPKHGSVRYWFEIVSGAKNIRLVLLATSGGILTCTCILFLEPSTWDELPMMAFAWTSLSFGIALLLWFVIITIDMRICVSRSVPTKRQTPSLRGLVQFADWWGLDLRKRIKTLAGDYDAEIRRLWREDRYLTARWNKALAWTFAFWYIGRGPWDWIRALLLLAVKGK